MPTYVRLSANAPGYSGPAWSGKAYSPFLAPNGEARGLSLIVGTDRVNDRRALRQSFDSVNSEMDRSGLADGLDSYEQQASA